MNLTISIKIFLVAVIILTFGCENTNTDFRKSVLLDLERGTDSTKEWIYLKEGVLVDTNKYIEAKIIQLGTLIVGGTYILTSFDYSKESGYRRIKNITTKLSIDDISYEYGHYYDFETNEYAWLTGQKNNASYICSFDSLGNILKEQGSIQVDGYKRSQNSIRDLFYTTAFHNIDSVCICSQKLPNKKYISKPHTWMPMMDYISLDCSVDSVFFIKTYATRRKDMNKQIYYDTFWVN